MWRRVKVEEGKGEEWSREEEEGRRGREYGLKRGREREREGEAGILGEKVIEEMWGREGLEGRRREEWRSCRSTWRAEYHVTTGQKKGKGERRT